MKPAGSKNGFVWSMPSSTTAILTPVPSAPVVRRERRPRRSSTGCRSSVERVARRSGRPCVDTPGARERRQLADGEADGERVEHDPEAAGRRAPAGSPRRSWRGGARLPALELRADSAREPRGGRRAGAAMPAARGPAVGERAAARQGRRSPSRGRAHARAGSSSVPGADARHACRRSGAPAGARPMPRRSRRARRDEREARTSAAQGRTVAKP